LLGVYLLPFLAVLFWSALPAWAWIGLAAIQGIGMAGVGMSVMHDSLHGSLSPTQKVNERWGWTMYLLGGSVLGWKMQHHRAHHTYTTILGHDEDIRDRGYLRFSAHAPWNPIHRYQHLYALALYPLTNFSMLVKDFPSLRAYERDGLLAEAKTTYSRQLKALLWSKGIYVGLFIGLPILTGSLTWAESLGYFAVVNLVCGFILSVVFQLAHVVEEATQPAQNTAGNIENEWMIHQLETTVNFCPKNKLLNWYAGGLNYQVEHHLFPNICHIHYPALAHIVKATADEFGITYNQADTFAEIMGSHLRFLKTLGQEPAPVVAVREEEPELVAA
jgi:linoleoyl-CoA desaturase